jgi:Nif-specific regulatory protein
VLILGESGTGKELVARAVHSWSRRRGAPFVIVDGAGLPETLIEAELFGATRGAYTGADRDRPGRVQEAEGGTLFIDEIAELPLSVQGRLLRLLQERSFHRLGSPRPERADVRFVAATWRNLEEEVRRGRFRPDLYWRLRVVEIRLPSLVERGHAELDRLIDTFLARYAERYARSGELSPLARARLHAREWRGNVRELEHAIEAAVALNEGPVIGVEDIDPPGLIASGEPGVAGAHGGKGIATEPREGGDRLDAAERAHIVRVLEASGGNRSLAAERLGIGRNTLARKLNQGE